MASTRRACFAAVSLVRLSSATSASLRPLASACTSRSACGKGGRKYNSVHCPMCRIYSPWNCCESAWLRPLASARTCRSAWMKNEERIIGLALMRYLGGVEVWKLLVAPARLCMHLPQRLTQDRKQAIWLSYSNSLAGGRAWRLVAPARLSVHPRSACGKGRHRRWREWPCVCSAPA